MENIQLFPKESATQLIKRGWSIIPLHYPLGENECSCKNQNCSSNGKHPMTKNGLKNASQDLVSIENWWRSAPRANIGILTGLESGLVVLDVDPRHGGEESLKNLEIEFGALPKTLAVKTGGDGWHYYFKHPGGKISNKASFRNGLDIRGDGGYIVAPPSIHASLKPYQWINPTEQIADIPQWLLQLITSPQQTIKKDEQSKSEQESDNSEGFPDGTRNDSLLSVGGFLISKGLPSSDIAKALQALNQSLCHPPLDPSEVDSVVSSLTRYKEKPWEQKTTELPQEPMAYELPVEMLPAPLQKWCADISERMQVPLEFVAGPAIVALSSVIGRKVVIYPKINDNWEVIPNLWGCLIAPPGSMKSPVLSAVLKPIQNLAVKAREAFIETSKKIEAEKTVAKTEIEALKDALKVAIKQGKQQIIDEKKELLANAIKICDEKYNIYERRYMMNDPTIEKLLTIIQENPQGLMLYRDELSGWIETMYKSGREGDREFFLEAWNGDSPYSMDRVGRGSIFVDGLCLCVLGGLQPTKFQAYVESLIKGGKSDDGLLQRFQILLYPEKRKSWQKIDRLPNKEAAEVVDRIFLKLADLPIPTRKDNEIQRTYIRFNHEAQILFDQWRENLEMRLLAGNMSPILESHLSKYRSLMPSLAYIFEVVENLGQEDIFPKAIGVEAVKLAIRWCEFLEVHAKKSFGEFIEPGIVSARKLLQKIKSGAVKDFDRCRDIYRHGWKGISSFEEFERALSVLEKLGWARAEVFTTSAGRRCDIIRLHPSLRFS